jgi:hypothetical protein
VKPEIRYARNDGVAIAYAVIGTGPDDLLYLSPYNNLEIVWENPLMSASCGGSRRPRG